MIQDNALIDGIIGGNAEQVTVTVFLLASRPGFLDHSRQTEYQYKLETLTHKDNKGTATYFAKELNKSNLHFFKANIALTTRKQCVVISTQNV